MISATGTLAEVNPIRYRGYYYDNETGLYYVSSRYFDPKIGRFINADDLSLLGANGDFSSTNLFAYCSNNPVVRIDGRGHFWNIIAGAAVSAGLEFAGQLLSGASITELNWAKVGVSAVSGGLSAAVGPLAGSIISGATDVAMDAIDGKIASVTDAVISFGLGTAKAAASYGVGTFVGKKLNSLTKIESVGKMGEAGYPGVKYSYNKGKGRAVRSVEIHPRHNGHGIHLQINKWNPRNGKRTGVVLRKTLVK